MTTRPKTTFAVGVLLLLSALLPVPIHADKPENMTLFITRFKGTPGGTWEATGALNDSGTWIFDSRRLTPTSSNGFTAHLIVTFTGADGSTFTADFQALFARVSDDPIVYAGHERWHVAGGTGDYADLQGVGEVSGLLDLSLPAAYLAGTGRVH